MTRSSDSQSPSSPPSPKQNRSGSGKGKRKRRRRRPGRGKSGNRSTHTGSQIPRHILEHPGWTLLMRRERVNLQRQVAALPGHLQRLALTLIDAKQPSSGRDSRHKGRGTRQGSGLDLSQLSPPKELSALLKQYDQGIARYQKRVKRVPTVAYPKSFPVSDRRDEIKKLLDRHQVIILCGETGSGKTTQLPRICLEMGRGREGWIGMTQPRRIAARNVTNYVAESFESRVGEIAGYAVRFEDKVNSDSFIKVMTDGLLLNEINSDSLLDQYDTLIIDEAHERSLNIDFLLGYVKRILPQRPDLKVIVSSATLDTEKFSKHFNNAPILEISGRMFPVEVRYRPLISVAAPGEKSEELELMEGIGHAVAELNTPRTPGDILVFLPGEREIRDAGEVLRKTFKEGVEVLPLYARLSPREQQRIFRRGEKRRVILSTNVAETSLTVPGIRFVIDSGLARISRFSGRSQVQRLPVEEISQASANQRMGRCGRLADGICIRLFSEENFNNRVLFTDPEILRTSLAAVIMQMKASRLGEIQHFPFIDPPNPRAIRDALRLLRDLQALNERDRLTQIGKRMARLPVDPRIGRMLIESERRHCVREMLIVAAALSVQDPRVRPSDMTDAADTAHRPTLDNRSDFTGFLTLWKRIISLRQEAPSRSQYRKRLKKAYLSYLRIQEWRDIRDQLKQRMSELKIRVNSADAGYGEIHKSLLVGLVDHVGFKEEKHRFAGVRQSQFHIFPGSGLFAKPPKWIMAAERVETSKLYARTCAKIEPEWIEEVAGHLCSRTYSEPSWQKERGQVVAKERVTLSGLVVHAGRSVNFGTIDPGVSRQIFIQSALVEGHFHSQAPFFLHNRSLIEEVHSLEHRSRRKDLMIDDAELFTFYDARIPEEIVNQKGFDAWRKETESSQPRHLFLDRERLTSDAANQIDLERYPGHLLINGHEIALEYTFNPGHGADGVSACVPLPLLNQIPADAFDWLVPGLIEDKVLALLKGLPKSLRRHLVPIPKTAEACLARLTFQKGPLLSALEEALLESRDLQIPSDAWNRDALPDHLRMNIKVLDDDRIVAQGRDPIALRRGLTESAKRSFASIPKKEHEKTGLKSWTIGPIATTITLEDGDEMVTGFPGLEDRGQSVSLRIFDDPERADSSHEAGVRRLFLLQLPSQVRFLRDRMKPSSKICLGHASIGPCKQLMDELLNAAVESVFFPGEGREALRKIREAEQFRKRLNKGRSQFARQVETSITEIQEIMVTYLEIRTFIQGAKKRHRVPPPDALDHLATLMKPGFYLEAPLPWRHHLGRYLKAVKLRLQRWDQSPTKDAGKEALITPHQRAYTLLKERCDRRLFESSELESARWMLEEYRVSVFAPELRTSIPVSNKRLNAQRARIRCQ
ncbi:MAG: ATP-dependent RNA helicase HrpA [Magnetococcales bacterium]|nr:ATP-dependent RNA helicase HrpA [Magnetococcales bacterium]